MEEKVNPSVFVASDPDSKKYEKEMDESNFEGNR